MNKSYALSIIAAFALSACSAAQLNLPFFGTSTPAASAPATPPYSLASNHWADVAKIRAEAQRLGTQVRAGQITKVQAAQHLNRFRLRLVGSNMVDDSVYEVYQQAAVENYRGKISVEQSKAYIENALRGWQQRWGNMQNKPTNPAFTNFLLEFMKMQTLQ